MSQEPRAGAIVGGHYALQRKIGSGGFGEVWEARDERALVTVAVKFLLGAADLEAKRRFRREVSALKRIDHANCLRILASGELPTGARYLVTELVPGRTLHDWFNDGPQRVHQHASEVVHQICSALVAAHDLGIIHRDLKPANIMVTPTDAGLHVKVLDFGLAKLAGVEHPDITKTGEVMGTTGYMSPEQLRGRRDIGPPTDMYCLGLIAFALLEGRPPFDGASPLAIGHAHLTVPAPPVRRGPAEMGELVADLLAKNPGDRPTARQTLRRLGVDPGPERAQGATARRSWLLAGVIGALALAGIAAWLVSQRPPAPTHPVRRATPAIVRTAEADAGRSLVPDLAVVPAPSVRDASASSGCGNTIAQVQGRKRETIRTVGLGMTVGNYLPTSYDPDIPMPLVVLMRDSGEYANLLDLMDMTEAAERDGFILIAPEKAGTSSFVPAISLGTRTAIDNAERTLCIDRSRIYLVSHGRSGQAVEDILCQPDWPIAAVVTWAHRDRVDDGVELCGRVPRLAFTGRADPSVPIEGGSGPCRNDLYISLEAHNRKLRALNGCEGTARTESDEGPHDCETWGCAVPYVSCVFDGGHHWLGSFRPSQGDHCNGEARPFPAERIWGFLRLHRATSN